MDRINEDQIELQQAQLAFSRIADQYLSHIANHPDQYTNAEHAWITIQQSRNKKRFLESTEIRKRELDTMIKGVEAEMGVWGDKWSVL